MSDQINPDHYRGNDLETWEMMVKIWGMEEFKIFCKLNAFKYRMRAAKKPEGDMDKAIEDIKKALWYENKKK